MISDRPKKKRIPGTMSLGAVLRKQLKALLDGGEAHASFADAVKGFPPKLRGVVPEGLPYSAWQLVEHMRIAQRDILEFSDNEKGGYKPMKWPDDYWPKSPEPPTPESWDESIAEIKKDRAKFERLVESQDDANLVEAFSWGDGQNLLREALLIADHQAYHIGELIVLRRLLKAWKG